MPDHSPAAFISYCRVDQDFALRLAQDLKAAGAAVWLDQLDIRPGKPWDNAVEDALRSANKMLVILTPISVASENVRDEIAYALKQGKTVIPVLYLECDIPLRLERKQHIDFRADYAGALKRLLHELRVDHPDQAVLEKAAEGDERRRLAWQAREAEADRRRQEQIVPVASPNRVESTQPTRETVPNAPPRSAVPPAPQFVPVDAPAFTSDHKANPAPAPIWKWAGGGVAAILVLMVGLFAFHKSPSAPVEITPSPKPEVIQPTPQPVVPQPAPSPAGPNVVVKPAAAPPPKPDKGNVTPPDPKPAQPTPVQPTPAQPKPVQPAEPTKVTSDPESLDNQARALVNSQRYADALPLLAQSCNGGYVPACNDLGLMYLRGTGVAQDYRKAGSLFTTACNAGGPAACDNLGIMYGDGKGVGRDYNKSFAFFSKSCTLGFAGGCSDLGVSYEHGAGVAQNFTNAATFYTKGCNGGNAVACGNLGNLYRLGEGVPIGLAVARQYFQKACGMGDTRSCTLLKSAN